MMENKIVAIEVGNPRINYEYKEGFTTNKNYRGHKNGVPVYYSKFLEEGEEKEIMSNQEIKTLNEGSYLAKVEQVIRKHGKDANGNEDLSKKIISIELNVKGETDRFYYLTFCVEGYSEEQTKYANDDIAKICEEFGIAIIEELAGKIVVLNAVKNKNGFINYFIHEKRDFFDWENFEGFKYNDMVKLPCIVKKFYKRNNKIIFVVNVDINGNVEEFVNYNLNNDYDIEGFKRAMKRLDVNEDYLNVDLKDKKAYLVVKKVVKNGNIFFNKKLGFDKLEQRKPQEW